MKGSCPRKSLISVSSWTKSRRSPFVHITMIFVVSLPMFLLSMNLIIGIISYLMLQLVLTVTGILLQRLFPVLSLASSGRYFVISYNIESAARQARYDQWCSTVIRPSILSSSEEVAASFDRLVFNSHSSFISNFVRKRQRPIIGRQLLVTRNWQSFWSRETKALRAFCSSPSVRDAAPDVISTQHSDRITIPQKVLADSKLQSCSKGKNVGSGPCSNPISSSTQAQLKEMLSVRRVFVTFAGSGTSSFPEPRTPVVDPVSPLPIDYLDV